VREAEIDSDAAALFFLESVGVDAGERLDQCGFSVVDMAGRAYNDRFHGFEILPESSRADLT